MQHIDKKWVVGKLTTIAEAARRCPKKNDCRPFGIKDLGEKILSDL